MKLKKLFQVLVLGGAAVGLPHCGPGPETDPNGTSSTSSGVGNGGTATDGGTNPADSGSGGGGPHFW